jgi:AraC-like DNA-binding protein
MEAKRYLYYTDQSAKEIADRLGFEDAANFSRFFKTNTGIAPTDFKNSIKLSQKQIIKQH